MNISQRDGATNQVLLIVYPFSIIFCPCITSFICGTLKMALIPEFLSYLCPSLIISSLCLYFYTQLMLKRFNIQLILLSSFSNLLYVNFIYTYLIILYSFLISIHQFFFFIIYFKFYKYFELVYNCWRIIIQKN